MSSNVLITGCCGTVGKELVRQLLSDESGEVNQVCGIDNNESELFFLDQHYSQDKRADFVLADIRDCDALIRLFENVDVVYHTAALKHVGVSEKSPMEAVNTNILGVQNIISAAEFADVSKVMFTSSDKAVNPTSVMGTSKLMGERLMTAAQINTKRSDAKYISTRFGNVLGSSGSVVPLFRKQILNGGPVTLTDIDMTRFIMTVEEAAKLVLESAKIGKGGEVLVTKMPVIKIMDLANVMIQYYCKERGMNPDLINIEIIGCKPGEKMYEELMSLEEVRRTIELDSYFSVKPAFVGEHDRDAYIYKGSNAMDVSKPYNSSVEEHMDIKTLENYLFAKKILK